MPTIQTANFSKMKETLLFLLNQANKFNAQNIQVVWNTQATNFNKIPRFFFNSQLYYTKQNGTFIILQKTNNQHQ